MRIDKIYFWGTCSNASKRIYLLLTSSPEILPMKLLGILLHSGRLLELWHMIDFLLIVEQVPIFQDEMLQQISKIYNKAISRNYITYHILYTSIQSTNALLIFWSYNSFFISLIPWSMLRRMTFCTRCSYLTWEPCWRYITPKISVFLYLSCKLNCSKLFGRCCLELLGNQMNFNLQKRLFCGIEYKFGNSTFNYWCP